MISPDLATKDNGPEFGPLRDAWANAVIVNMVSSDDES
ncbi:hypothetical protein LPU83_pLPU83c_0572 (plasmid) [Rhizobium favelukesii]|uniref:Uncharacterized protein n=1 Tax=Rhizobium favelukesii TaxID=348824 RepID=W6RJV1_9HYPH|nr:hypothetical protein LPU83_pLPU83c_0572 [Rhizobium favelukesii]